MKISLTESRKNLYNSTPKKVERNLASFISAKKQDSIQKRTKRNSPKQ